MKNRGLFTALLAPVFILLIPAVMMQISTEWNWGAGSFIVAYILMAGVGLSYLFITSKSASLAYKSATGIGLFTGFLLLWVNMAVGLIGSEDNPANLMYLGVIVIGAIGAALARFAPLGMSQALFVTALAQFLVPVIALIVRRPDFSPGVVGVFGLNFFFVLLFTASAVLYRHAGSVQKSSI